MASMPHHTAARGLKKKPIKKKRQRPKHAKGPRRIQPAHKVYVTINEKDVLMGRGGFTNKHPGNKRYLREVKTLAWAYRGAQKREKTAVSQQLVDRIHSLGGRFLEKEPPQRKGTTVDVWFEVTNHTARTKASQALREACKSVDPAARLDESNKSTETPAVVEESSDPQDMDTAFYGMLPTDDPLFQGLHEDQGDPLAPVVPPGAMAVSSNQDDRVGASWNDASDMVGREEEEHSLIGTGRDVPPTFSSSPHKFYSL